MCNSNLSSKIVPIVIILLNSNRVGLHLKLILVCLSLYFQSAHITQSQILKRFGIINRKDCWNNGFRSILRYYRGIYANRLTKGIYLWMFNFETRSEHGVSTVRRNANLYTATFDTRHETQDHIFWTSCNTVGLLHHTTSHTRRNFNFKVKIT